MSTNFHEDKALIDALGGVHQVVALMSYEPSAANIQRVKNWLTRGIPSKVKVERPDLFLLKTKRVKTPRYEGVERRNETQAS